MDIGKLVNKTPIVDSHEHLWEEKDRINSELKDFGVLFHNYIFEDLISSGMPPLEVENLIKSSISPGKKWELLKPWWPKVKHNGYGLMVRESIRALIGENDVNDHNWEKISQKIKDDIKPGFYEKILKDICNIDHCQVNALDVDLFRETEIPELLKQDFRPSQISSDFDPEIAKKYLGKEIQNLDDCLETLDQTFALFGKNAIAIKNPTAYRRNLDYERWSEKEVERCIKECLNKGWDVSFISKKPLEDYLFHYSMEKANEYGLPVKLHTGYFAGTNQMPLHRVRHNGGDMSKLCMEHPETKFVFMHITYPYQDEAIALAKHFSNAYIDMCWAWILNPAASIRFLKEFLMAAPLNKILTFGGDVLMVEQVPGTVRVARKGITQALIELTQEGWLNEKELPGIIEQIMWKNAFELFPGLGKNKA